MKILQIFGAVIAVHLLAFIFIFASPGCQTGPRNIPTPDATMPTGPSAPPVAYNSSVVSPQPVDLVAYSPASPSGHAVPTRPGSPAAAAITPAKPMEEVAPVSTYTVTRGDSLWTIAKKNHLTVAELAKANNVGTGVALQPGRKLIIPGKPASAMKDLATAGPSGPTYKVIAGDSLASIARRHGTPTAAFRAANNLTSDTVRSGQELRLPEGAKLLAAADSPAISGRPNGESVKHTVQVGESLGVIARKYQVTVFELASANNITDPSKVRAGQQLIIPGFKAVNAKGTTGATPSAKPAGKTAAASETPAPPPPAPHFEITAPPPGQDLDSGLKGAGTEVPTIKVEEPKPDQSPKK